VKVIYPYKEAGKAQQKTSVTVRIAHRSRWDHCNFQVPLTRANSLERLGLKKIRTESVRLNSVAKNTLKRCGEKKKIRVKRGVRKQPVNHTKILVKRAAQAQEKTGK